MGHRTLASGLERVVRNARRPPRGRSAAVPVAADEVLLAAPVLLELAQRLRRNELAPERCPAVRALLTDVASPLHAPAHEGELRDWAHTLLSG